ncbi:MAG TPA: hypothetical protein VMX97_02465 [Hyphomicrobiaceae bacterium]|nr:hypothetical protein [Hyphomicrobiaceae bacterium]
MAQKNRPHKLCGLNEVLEFQVHAIQANNRKNRLVRSSRLQQPASTGKSRTRRCRPGRARDHDAIHGHGAIRARVHGAIHGLGHAHGANHARVRDAILDHDHGRDHAVLTPVMLSERTCLLY